MKVIDEVRPRSLTVCCCTNIRVPQVRRVFVFAPNLGYHEPQPEQNHPVRDLADLLTR